MDLMIAGLLTLALLVAAIIVFRKKKRGNSIVPLAATSLQDVVLRPDSPKPERPEKIVIGTDALHPAVTISALPDVADFNRAKPLDIANNKPISRLSALCQAAPSILVASEAHGKKLMEVVVNGDLVRAADGNGFRAIVMGPDGIKEHAKLFEVKDLQNMINAAAVWQIASVVVAQKHLADISRKLDDIKSGVEGISRFLGNQRKARIRGTYEYLTQVHEAIRAGAFPVDGRKQLEDCERDLLEIQHHLEMEFRQEAEKKVEHTETFGTEDLTSNIRSKISGLDELVADMEMCVKTRIAAWHIFSLFPGESELKTARRRSIQKSAESLKALAPHVKQTLSAEISAINSFWNKAKTLETRKQGLADKCDAVVLSLSGKANLSEQAIANSERLLLEHDQPTRILFQVENGQIVDAREALVA